MALAFIRESVASSIIDNLVGTAYSFLKENLLPAGDMEAELERLEDTLPQIKMVLSAVENDEIKNDNTALNSWLWRFRDAVDCAEDVLDEMAYYELEKKIKGRDNEVGGSVSDLKRKFASYVNRKFKNETVTNLVKAVKGLDRAAAGVRNFLDLKREPSRFRGKNSEENDRETGSMLTESVVFGREKERESIVEWLTTDPSVGDVKLSAFTIYGIGGLGKTTLAQLIYADEKVKQFFNPIIWVCVSDRFDAVIVIAKILEVMTKESPEVRSLTSLQDALKENLISKKFLLVLDDVWNDENRSEWEKLIAPLKFGHGKSKILVTTRMESVADMVAKVIMGKNERLKLDGLEENDFLKLFNNHAFHGVDPNEFKNLHTIGKQIANKLGGCPLAAKVMGGVLNYCIEFEFWNKILKEDVPGFQEGKDGIMRVLRLSYRHLPTHLQLCFRYCSIFPKNYQFTKNELIWMWLGSGLIEPVTERQQPEDVGGGYFNRLVKKSFFDLRLEEFAGKFSQHYFVMHDLLHDLAQDVSKDECSRIEEKSLGIPKTTIRHLNFKIENLLSVKKILRLKNLHTLCIIFEGEKPNEDDIKEFGAILKGFKSLRLLSLTLKDLFKVPDTIGELIHLRYLSLESKGGRQELSWFPQSVYKLYNLEIIKFSSPFVKDIEEREKKGIINLVKLRHLDVPFQIQRKFPCIGRLIFIQELVFSAGEERGYKISELKDLRSLRQLSIMDLENVKDHLEAKEAKLNEKEKLKDLTLKWSSNDSGSPEEHQKVIENLRPHLHLEKLEIINYGGVESPYWMTHFVLVNLISLHLSSCLMVTLPALGKLPLLKCLRLSYLSKVKQIDHTFYGNNTECAFPVLKELNLRGLEELEEWTEIQGMTLFPRLEHLDVSNSRKLRRLPCLPPTLTHLVIYHVGLEVLPKIYSSVGIEILPSSKPTLSYLSIIECPNLTGLDECLLQQQEHMQALSALYIENCQQLARLSSTGFMDFISLRDLTIVSCPILATTSLTPDNLLPASLKKLRIGRNTLLDVPLLGSIQNLTALTNLYLSNCSNITFLPPVDILATLTSLFYLTISCPELSSLSGIEALTSLRRLAITGCDKLVTMSLSQPPLSANVGHCLLRLDKLYISHASLILLEPLRSLKLTKELVITDASSLTSLPEEWLLQNRNALQSLSIFGATNIASLPSCIEKLVFLEDLHIFDVRLVQSLPDLPLSLNSLAFTGCHPDLLERYKKDIGPEWYRIAFIAHVELSG